MLLLQPAFKCLFTNLSRDHKNSHFVTRIHRHLLSLNGLHPVTSCIPFNTNKVKNASLKKQKGRPC